MQPSIRFRALVCSLLFGTFACSGGSDAPPPTSVVAPDTDPVIVVTPIGAQVATAGVAYSFDATRNNTTFNDPRRTGLTYAVSFAPASNGFTVVAGRIAGTPTAPAMTTVTIIGTDASGRSATHAFSIVTFSSDLQLPVLPQSTFNYSDATAPLPVHFTVPGGPGGPVIATDNTPPNNVTTNAGATLGRVLFYDRRLSTNDRVACSSCHLPQFAFGDTAKLSVGFAGGRTGRHSMALANARFYQPGRFFWDERAATLEAQVLQPIQDTTEMGMTLPNLLTKLSVTSYYAALFQSAFGTTEISSDRVSRALAQYVRSLVSATSKFDQAFAGGPVPNFPAIFTPDELAGQAIFNGQGGCARCHGTSSFVGDAIHNTGLDATITDVGAGGGRFKAPSLKNIAVRPPYMHDGRFNSLEQVVDFYNNGVLNNPNLDNRLRGPGGLPQRLNLNVTQRNQVVAFLRTLTDVAFMTNAKFANPFAQ